MNASAIKWVNSALDLDTLRSKKKFEPKLKTVEVPAESPADSMIMAVIFIATIYWVLDSILNIFFSNKFNLIAELIGPDLYDIYLRAIVLCLFIIFGSHAQTIINKLRQAKQKLNESEELWRSLVATAPDMITTVDQGGIIRFINRNIAGLAPKKALGRSIFSLLPEEFRELATESIEGVFATGESDSFEIRMGDLRNPRWYTYRVGALKLEGKVIAATIISSDTTEFKRAEELMRYKELFDNVTEGVFMFTPKGKLIESNDRITQSTGYTKAEFLELNISKILEPDQIPFVESQMKTAREENEVRFELNIMSKDGTLIPNEINCRYVTYLGRPCFLWVARDITETKILQNQLIRSERLVATGQLAASIAHEINSPLQGITALLSVIRLSHGDDAELLKKLDIVKQAFGSIRDTVRNLIDLNRPGKELKQPMDANQVITNTIALVRSHLRKNRVDIRLNLTAEMSKIIASPQQIGQVIMNLVNNAVESITGTPGYWEKHRDPSSVGGEIRITSSNQDDMIVITVEDTGRGIAPKDLEHLFDPFFTRKKTMGMGVGLSICHGIIEDHKGVITADNSPQGGAVFTIRLPL